MGRLANCCRGGTTVLDVGVTCVGTLLSETVSDSTIGSISSTIYETYVFGFVADSGSATVFFTDLSASGGFNFDAHLDRVSVVAVPIPEPSTASLLALGLLALAAMRANRSPRAH